MTIMMGTVMMMMNKTYDAKSPNRTRATLVGGECSHHCAIPAPNLS